MTILCWISSATGLGLAVALHGRRSLLHGRAGGGDQRGEQAGAPVGPGRRTRRAGVGLGEGPQQVERVDGAAAGVRHGRDGLRVLAVAPGREVDEGEVLTHERHHERAVVVGHAQPLQDGVGDRGPGLGVVARPGDLADVVQQRREQEQVGPRDLAQQAAGPHHRLDEVPVDGVPVDGVALRSAAHGPPLRDPPLDDPREVEALPDGHEPGAGRQQVAEHGQGLLGPGLGQRGAARGQVGQGRRRDGHAVAGGDERRAQHEQRVGRGVDARAQHGLPVVQVEAVAEGHQLGPPRAHAQGAGPLRLRRPAQGAVEGVGDGPRRRRHVGQQQVGVAVAEQRGRRVVVLAAQPVATATGDDVDGVAHVEQPRVRRVDRPVRTVGQPRRGQRAQQRHVAQPAPGLLEVGLDEVREVALPGVAGDDALVQLGQAGAGVGPPVVGHGRAGGVDDVGVAGDVGDVEQPDGGRQVGAGDRAALVDRAHAVVELHPLVPDGVPQAVGEPAEVLGPEGPGLVEQDEVVVAEGSAVTAGEGADRGEGDPGHRPPLGGLGPTAR